MAHPGQEGRFGIGGVLLAGFLAVWAGRSSLLVGAGAGAPAKPAAPEAVPAPTPSKADIAGKAADEDYRKPYLDFRGLPADGDAAKSGEKPPGNLGDLLAHDAERVEPEFLTVTVPDPIDSRFGYRFDAVLDAVQMAVESQGWNLDRFWLPWRPSGLLLKDRTDLKPVRTPDGRRFLHECYPGVLLFRQPRDDKDKDKKQRLLVVMLVGETPTSGVARVALAECFSVVQSFRHAGHQRRGEVLTPATTDFRIVGPFFSGSEQSLSRTIGQWMRGRERTSCCRDWTVTVRTGSADQIDGEKFINDTKAASGEGVHVAFDATVYPIKSVMTELFRYLKHLNGGAPLGKVALLSESDTEYGNVTKLNIGGWAGDENGDNPVTSMKFPFHISQVAVADHQSVRRDDPTTPSLARTGGRLAIPFDEVGIPRDVIPALSPAMSTATDSFVLSKILETISTEDFRYIGIMATDTRDTIFLAGLIRQYCPDVQLFAPAGDLLLGHPTYADGLRGMIVATPYPLFSMAQRWDPPYEGDHRRHLFSHQGDQGTYNAALSLLAESNPSKTPRYPDYFRSMFDYGTPFDELSTLSALWKGRKNGEGPGAWLGRPSKPRWTYRICSVDERPALWFSVIGQRGLWPVKYKSFKDLSTGGKYTAKDLDYTHPLSYSREVGEEPFVRQFVPLLPQFTWTWGIVFLALSGFAWFLALLHERFRRAPHSRLYPGFGWWEAVRPVAPKKTLPLWGRVWREWFVLAGLLAFSVAYGYCVLVPAYVAFRFSPWAVFLDTRLWPYLPVNDRWEVAFMVIVLVVGPLTVLGLLRTIAVRVGLAYTPPPADAPVPGDEPARTRLRARARGAAAVALALASCLPEFWLPVVFRWQWDDRPEAFSGLLTFERFVNVGSGVSPLVPVLLLGGVLGLWYRCRLDRLYISRQYWGAPHKAKRGAGRRGAARHVDPRSNEAGSRSKVIRPRSKVVRLRLMRVARYTKQVKYLVQITFPPGLLVQIPLAAALLAAVAVLVRLLQRATPSVDFPGGWTTLLMVTIWLLGVSVLLTLGRFVAVWLATATILREVATWPMMQAFDRIPRQYARSFGRYLDQARPTVRVLAVPVQQWAVVAKGYESGGAALSAGRSDSGWPGPDRFAVAILTGKNAPAPAPSFPKEESATLAIHKAFEDDVKKEDSDPTFSLHKSPTWTGLRNAARACIELLEPVWEARLASAGYGEVAPVVEAPGAAKAGGGPPPAAAAGGLDRWVRSAEDLVALEIVAYVGQCNVHLKNLAWYLALAPILLLVAVSSYPIQPQRFLQVCLMALLLAVAGCVVGVYVAMERNELLSRISKTRANRVEFDGTFLTNVLAFVVPLVGVVLAQFPYVSDLLSQWFEPIGRVVK